MALTLFLALAPLFAPAEAKIHCDRVESGPAGSRLLIKVTQFEEVVAVAPGPSGQIFVSDDQRMRPLGCHGGRPTMANVGIVDFRADRGADNSALFIAEAPRFEGVDFVLHGRALGLGIGGTDSPDTITLGTAGGAAAVDFAADLGPADPLNETAAVDARAHAKLLTIVVRGGTGGDLVDGTPSRDSTSPFDAPLRAYLTAYGEGGDDSIVGGRARDYLDGGTGNDVIDSIDGRSGEEVTCGSGRDLVRRDHGDEAEGCERTRFR
jgi:Ca2+-binding RTX toxin-like protein